jgi:hypothetical protein
MSSAIAVAAPDLVTIPSEMSNVVDTWRHGTVLKPSFMVALTLASTLTAATGEASLCAPLPPPSAPINTIPDFQMRSNFTVTKENSQNSLIRIQVRVHDLSKVGGLDFNKQLGWKNKELKLGRTAVLAPGCSHGRPRLHSISSALHGACAARTSPASRIGGGAAPACSSGLEGPAVCRGYDVVSDAQPTSGGGGDTEARQQKARREMQHPIYI